MDKLTYELFEIIKDHRKDENFMTIQRVSDWINQFEEKDREFVLQETIHIFKQRYISQEDGRKHMKQMIEYVTNLYEIKEVKDFISQSYFINNQAPGKSQSVLLEFLDEILQSDYSTSLASCDNVSPKYVLYMDDIMCTGETLIDGLTHNVKGWFNQQHSQGGTNYDMFKRSNSELILGYLAIHLYCSKKLKNRLGFKMQNRPFRFRTIWNTELEIDNDLTNPNSSLNYLYVTEETLDENLRRYKEQIELKINSKGYNTNKMVFRPIDKPKEEVLFSSEENRSRYEKIILNKSIEYYKYIEDNLRARPLGYGLNHDISFGFGTMIFTWRNVPFNTPLVFWYGYNGCTPLFERVYT